MRRKISNARQGALQRAIRFLAYRPRSEAEVMTYLAARGYPTALAEATLEKLRSLNYLNDESFARNWARAQSESPGYGPKRIEQELGAKGITQALARAVVRETFGEGGEREKARSLLEKKFKNKNLDDPKALRQATAFLQRHGYSSSVIFDLLKVSIEDD
ncbi:MAG TPA: regulatory protein RecX [Candidatus Udaeobacter sp.]|nr:regulatory protein RecX [Candidatus Udaeobacter sp.]